MYVCMYVCMYISLTGKCVLYVSKEAVSGEHNVCVVFIFSSIRRVTWVSWNKLQWKVFGPMKVAVVGNRRKYLSEELCTSHSSAILVS